MPLTSLMDYVPLWTLFPLTSSLVLLSLECGYRMGRWRRQRSDQEKETPVGAMVGATLGLLAFMLAFTFSMAASRFDARREVFLAEVNAVGTAYLRADLLTEPQRSDVRGKLREYVDVRLHGVSAQRLEEAIRRSEELHIQLWSQAADVGRLDPHSIIGGLFIESLNEVIDLHTKRITAGIRARIPDSLWIVLYTITMFSMTAMGYQAGLSGTSRSLAALGLAFTFSLVIFLVADLDRPQDGLLRVSQQAMFDLQSSMTRAGN